MDTLHHEFVPATPDEVSGLEEMEDRLRAAEVLRRRCFPTLDREMAIGIAHAVVSHWNAETLASFCQSTGIR